MDKKGNEDTKGIRYNIHKCNQGSQASNRSGSYHFLNVLFIDISVVENEIVRAAYNKKRSPLKTLYICISEVWMIL